MILAPTLSLLSSGSGAIVRPTFSRDFAGEKTLNNGTGPAIAFTRGSTATYFDAAGTLQTASNDVPRFDHSGGTSLGLLIEEARTNSIRNAQAGGLSAGTPGTEPTNWPMTGTTNNVTRTIVGIGTENGLDYIDVKYAGTPTGNGGFTIGFEAANHIVAASGQTWTVSTYCKLEDGSLTGITGVRLGVDGRDASGSPLSPTQEGRVLFTPTGAALGTQRVSSTITLTSGAVRAFPFILVNYTGGVAMDITLRVAAPQLEQGAFPTSYIPTTSAAVTRSADSAVVDPISSFYNQSEGTLFAEFSRPQVSKFSSFLHFDDTTGNEMIALETGVASPSTQRFQVIDGNSAQAQIGNYTSATANTVYRMAGAYAVNDFAVSQSGSAAATDTGGTLPTVTRMAFSVTPSATYIRKIAYYPKRLSNALLQSLTT